MKLDRKCLYCKRPLEGRVDKLYCSVYCRSAFHYDRRKDKESSLFVKIDRQLKRNRRLLQHFNQAGKATIRAELLLDAGFDPNYFTHYWKTKKGVVYLFCYDHGFLKRQEHGRTKYILIQWQSYMEKN